MSWYSLAWILWALGFAAVETTALIRGDRPGRPRTLSATVWWLTRGAGRWHHLARLALVCALAWLSVHLLTGGWV